MGIKKTSKLEELENDLSSLHKKKAELTKVVLDYTNSSHAAANAQRGLVKINSDIKKKNGALKELKPKAIK